MEKERKQAFSIRITESNRTELVAIMFEIMDVYMEDAVKAKKADDKEVFRQNFFILLVKERP